MNFFGLKSDRDKNISKHIFLSIIAKGGVMIIGLLLVPLSISYLGQEKYGLWLTIFSFVGWFSFFDFGVGNGLRNMLAVSISKQDDILSKSLVSTAYFSIAFIVFLILLIFYLVHGFVSWDIIFNYSGNENIVKLILVVFTIFGFNLILKLIGSVYLADQKPSVPGFLHLFSQLIVLVFIFLAIKYYDQSLIFYGSVIISSQLLVFFITSLIAFSSKYSNISPTISSFNFKYVKEIMSLGGKFLMIQINAVIIYSTDNFIINYYLGAEQVSLFNIVVKYFSIISMGAFIIFNPYWSAFTEAITKKEIKWIKDALKKMYYISILACIVVIFMVFISKDIYHFWIGDSINIPFKLTIIIAVSSAILILKQPAVMLINGTGKLKSQMIVSTLSAIINIPLSIILAVNFELGLLGVVLATVVTGTIGLIVYNRQIYKFLLKTN